MKFSAEQLATLSKLSDEWLDLPPPQRAHWCDEAILQHPALAEAIAAMADDSSNSGMVPELTRVPTDQADEAAAFVAGEVLGPYRLVCEIGVGGMGVVWLAEQVDGHVSRTVALKLPLHHFAQQGLRSRFARERNILAGLDHPNIAKLLDAGITDAGQPYMAMQYVPGIAITAYCDQHKLDVSARLRLFIDLLNAVQHAHSSLVVHRDLKPSNILVTEEGRVVLLDFGIAKLLEPNASVESLDGVQSTPKTEFAGTALTLDYASPEQVAGQAVSTRTDIYSLGVVLYELLIGRRPYRLRRNSRAAIEEAVLEQEVQNPSTRVDDAAAARYTISQRALQRWLSGDLDAIVQKALAKVPALRYVTAQSFADDLQHWLRKEPVSAQPDKWSYRVRRLLIRRWRLIVVGASVSLVIVSTAAIAIREAEAAKRASHAAQEEARKAQAVTTFLKDLFKGNTLNQPDPAAARKRTSVELLDDGAKRIKESLSEAPELQIELMDTMADIFNELELAQQLISMSEQSASITRGLYGENHPKTVSKMAKLATAAFNTNDEVRFKEVLTSVRPYLEKWASSDNLTLRLAAAEVMDAMIVSMTTHFSESFQVARQAEKLYSSLPKKEFNLDRHHYLAMIYFKNFAFVNAVQHFDAAEERRRQKGEMFGAHIPTWHAQYFAFVGRYAEADKKFELARTIETHNQVPGVAQGNWVLAQVANYLTDTSRATESLSLNSRAFSAAADTPNVQLAPHALWARGKALARFGPIEEGLKLVTQANEIASQTGDTMAEIHIAYDHINALLELGRLDEAAVRLQSEKKLLEAGQFEMSSDSRQYWRLQIALHLAMGNIAKARELVEHSRAVLAPAGAGVGELLMGEWLEASVELQEGKLDQASHRLEAAIQRVAKSPEHLLMREWHANLEELRGVSLVAQGDRAAAQRSFEKALALNTAIFDAKTSIPVARVSLRLANLHKVAGRLKEAQFFQGRADAIRRTHPLFKQWVL